MRNPSRNTSSRSRCQARPRSPGLTSIHAWSSLPSFSSPRLPPRLPPFKPHHCPSACYRPRSPAPPSLLPPPWRASLPPPLLSSAPEGGYSPPSLLQRRRQGSPRLRGWTIDHFMRNTSAPRCPSSLEDTWWGEVWVWAAAFGREEKGAYKEGLPEKMGLEILSLFTN